MKHDEDLQKDLVDQTVYYNKDILFVPHYTEKKKFVAPGNKVFDEADLRTLPRKKMMLWRRK